MKLCLFGSLLAAFTLAFATACGDDDDPAQGDDANGNGGNAPASQTLDLAQTSESLLELDSFRFDLSMQLDLGDLGSGAMPEDELGAEFAAALLGAIGDIEAEGTYVAPESLAMTMSLGGEEIGLVQIGEQAWVDYGAGWEVAPPSADLSLGSPTDLVTEFLPQQVIEGAETSSETVNGVETTRYSFDRQRIEELIAASGEDPAGFSDISEAQLDVWVDAQQIPVKISMVLTGDDGSGQDLGLRLEMNIYDLNSSSLTVEPPI